jgi:RHS repeat-associated protein
MTRSLWDLRPLRTSGDRQLTRSTGTTAYTTSALGLTRETRAGGVQRNYTGTGTGEAVSTRFGASSKYYYIQDALGSVIGMFDKAGAYAGGYSYSPYGETRNPITAGTAADSNSLRYISGYFDRSSGLYKLGARNYDPTIGRFTQYDPSGQEASPYGYAGCNPISSKDPSGLRCIDVINVGLAAIFIGAVLVYVGAGLFVTVLGIPVASVVGGVGLLFIAVGSVAVVGGLICLPFER